MTTQLQPPAAPAAPPPPPAQAAVEPYVAIPGITDPKLSTVPDVSRFLLLDNGEQVYKSYRSRTRRPKFPWVWLVFSVVPLPFVVFVVYEEYRSSLNYYRWDLESYRYGGDVKADYMGPANESEYGGYGSGGYGSSSYDSSGYGSSPSDTGDYKGNTEDYPSADAYQFNEKDAPYDLQPALPDSSYPVTPEPDPPSNSFPHRVDPAHSPAAHLAGGSQTQTDELSNTPTAARLTVTPVQYAVEAEPERPTFPWPWLFRLLFLFSLPALAIALGFFAFRRRGHTFIYLTNRRLIVVELEEGLLGRSQTLMNFSLDNIAGFTVLAQRGLKRLLNLILLREKRTFYLSIITKTLAQFQVGAMTSLGSKYDPGPDAVTLCAELDAMVLGLKGK